MPEKNDLKSRLWRVVKRDAYLLIVLGLAMFVPFLGTASELIGVVLALLGVIWLVHSYTRIIALEIQERRKSMGK
jgi:uncharacterized membrane protein YidH (DUF202 family)